MKTSWTPEEYKLYLKTGLKPGEEKAEKKQKYNNKKTLVDGITFDSVKESNRYKELCILQKAGVVCDLRLQVQFQIIGLNRGKKGHYVADFVYLHREDGYVVEDVKGMKTDTYKLKKKLMKDLWNIDIKET